MGYFHETSNKTDMSLELSIHIPKIWHCVVHIICSLTEPDQLSSMYVLPFCCFVQCFAV